MLSYLCTVFMYLFFAQMILVADSGSSKTNWRLFDNKHGIRSVQTFGLNPYFVDAAGVTKVIDKDLLPYLDPRDVKEVYFYGSGCCDSDKIRTIEYPLRDIFRGADVTVESDLLGTARALCGNHEGLVGILGTGSNSSIYDGASFPAHINSLGFILGDEGSGAVLGKQLLKHYFEYKMPKELSDDFTHRYPLSLDKALTRIYREPFPNRFLSSFAPFASLHTNHPWMQTLLLQHFEEFFIHMVTIYQNYQRYGLYLSGSVAFAFKDMIETLADKFGIRLQKVIQQPIDYLLQYHLTNYQERT